LAAGDVKEKLMSDYKSVPYDQGGVFPVIESTFRAYNLEESPEQVLTAIEGETP
jgi:hypothetical protein